MGKTKYVEFYELLSLQPDATPEEIKKAYRRTALRLHPDRGGNEEDFKKMKAAYDVISDPNKRKMYDRYGPDVIKMMDGQAPDSMDFILALRKRDRLCMVFMISLISFILLLFPILLSVRWDAEGENTSPFSWAVAFIPLWILQTSVLALFFSLLRVEPLDSEEDREIWEKGRNELYKIRAIFSFLWLLLTLFEIFLSVRLDGVVSWSWSLVMLPFTIFCFLVLAIRVASSAAVYKGIDPKFHSPDENERRPESNVFTMPSYWLFLVLHVKWSVAMFVTSILVGVVADWNDDGNNTSFFIAAIPLLSVIGVAIIYRAAQWVFSGGEKPISSGEPAEEDAAAAESESGSFGKFISSSCPYLLLLVIVCCAAAKLTDDAVSAFAIFSPVFFVVGCVCCLCTVVITTVNPEDLQQAAAQQAQEAAAHGGDESTYGTVNLTEHTIQEETSVQVNIS